MVRGVSKSMYCTCMIYMCVCMYVCMYVISYTVTSWHNTGLYTVSRNRMG
jgi:hypothetical protein